VNRRQWLVLAGAGLGLHARRALAQGILRAPSEIRGEERRPTTEYRWLTIELFGDGTPAAEVLVTDPTGRKTGADSRATRPRLEIPGSSYGIERLGDITSSAPGDAWCSFGLIGGASGTYRLTVTGTRAGTYDLVAAAGGDMGDGSAEVGGVPTDTGVVHEYVVHYGTSREDPLRLTGGFPGDGVPASRAKALLTYASPTRARVELAPGEKDVTVVIFYGSTIEPRTFTATLDGGDVSARFRPRPGGHDIVPLSLRSASQALVLSVQGRSPAGQVATQTDRFVFVVR
jgi:hypothetical protein